MRGATAARIRGLLGGLFGCLGGNLARSGFRLGGCHGPRRARDVLPELPHAGLPAELAAEVVELGAVDVADRGDLDLLDLRRMQRERPLDPTPNDCLRTVKVSRAPAPWRLMTMPSKTWIRWRWPSITLKWTRTVSPALNLRDVVAQLRALECLDDLAHSGSEPMGRPSADGRRASP